MRGKPHVWETTDNGCIVSTSHRINQDGYLRIRDPRFSGEGRRPLIMAHRLSWENNFGTVPTGYEVDHKCRNRACVNPDHLQVLSRTDHLVKTNSERYAERKENARLYWEETGVSGLALGKIFGVSFSSACKWIREWKV
jgi:hypothetical protein